MKNILYTIILSLLFSFGVFADFEAGMDAYEQGDYAIALKEFKKLAKQGDAAGQVGLGSMYHDGNGVTQDYKESAKWFRLAADQGARPRANGRQHAARDDVAGLVRGRREAAHETMHAQVDVRYHRAANEASIIV